MNKQVQDFYQVDLSDLHFPIIVITFNTSDFPQKYVARIHDADKVTDTVVIRDTLEEIRETIPPVFYRMDRHPEDDPVIVEVWL